ncbi:MAG TPA: carboxypeptidase regulatory-like domain-containing protein, partial [Candidatus Eremiobacteraceae bacterium]|nr:carboxypeptidase regulatory-like domain-containing protein [Candidatus Eremiobacteraceae bacterium]
MSRAAGTGSISGHVVDASTGLPLQGVLVTTEGPATLSGTTNSNGAFIVSGLPAGFYILVTSLRGYESTSSDAIEVAEGKMAQATMSMQRSQAGAGARVLGRTTVRASQALQKASVIYASVNAAAAEKQGLYRAADVLRVLPAVVNDASDTATWGDDVTLDIRGIGSLETATLIDGHPTGANIGGYNFDISPIFGLRDVNVTYGSGGGDLYGVDAIGGVVDMQTLDPTVTPDVSFTEGYGSFAKLITAIHATGTLPNGRLGYAFAYGTQGQDGVIHHASFYQPGAAFDQSSSNPGIRALGIYPDDSSITSKGALAKFRYAFSPNQNVTLTAFGNAWYDNKTGNGDGDYLPFATALAKGNQNLVNYSPPNNSAPFNANNLPNCPAGTFAATNSGGFPNGFAMNGVSPDGGTLCQTPLQWANFNAGYQGAGPAWQGYTNQDYSLRWNLTQGNQTFSLNAFTNRYARTYDRTYTLPFPNSPFWQNTVVTATGFT